MPHIIIPLVAGQPIIAGSPVGFDGPTIDYCFLSEAMKSLPDLKWLRKGSPLPDGTPTAALAADPRRVLNGDSTADEIDVMDCLAGKKSARVTRVA